ncbi:MAG: magnesium transporter CorA family protein [Cyanobacteria bacterium SIG30]|nr:magnesium transporter CorA family protein [Cyanobacteria bacterium SIG30]
MIKIYKTDQDNNLIELGINEAQSGSWFNLIDPNDEEMQKVSLVLNLDDSFLRNSLDSDERSRIEFEDGHLLIITNVPIVEDGEFDTLPLGIIFTPTSFITVCSRENKIIKSFNQDMAKYFNTADKTQFLLSILFRTSKAFLRYLDAIYKKSEKTEEDLRKTMKNKALFGLFELQKALVYFTTALKDNYMVSQKLLRLTKASSASSLLKFTEEDIDLLEDVIIENKQALEMVEMHRNILENMMDAFASIISNNLNIVMKRLTSITIILAIPTMFASFWGMNVDLPNISFMPGFLFVFIISIIVALAAGLIFARKGMF